MNLITALYDISFSSPSPLGADMVAVAHYRRHTYLTARGSIDDHAHKYVADRLDAIISPFGQLGLQMTMIIII
jgi:hypothetical protein